MFQVLNSQVGPVATELDRVDGEHVHQAESSHGQHWHS